MSKTALWVPPKFPKLNQIWVREDGQKFKYLDKWVKVIEE